MLTISSLINPPLYSENFAKIQIELQERIFIVWKHTKVRWNRQDEFFRFLNKLKHNRPILMDFRPKCSQNPYQNFENPKKHGFVPKSRADTVRKKNRNFFFSIENETSTENLSSALNQRFWGQNTASPLHFEVRQLFRKIVLRPQTIVF